MHIHKSFREITDNLFSSFTVEHFWTHNKQYIKGEFVTPAPAPYKKYKRTYIIHYIKKGKKKERDSSRLIKNMLSKAFGKSFPAHMKLFL